MPHAPCPIPSSPYYPISSRFVTAGAKDSQPKTSPREAFPNPKPKTQALKTYKTDRHLSVIGAETLNKSLN